MSETYQIHETINRTCRFRNRRASISIPARINPDNSNSSRGAAIKYLRGASTNLFSPFLQSLSSIIDRSILFRLSRAHTKIHSYLRSSFDSFLLIQLNPGVPSMPVDSQGVPFVQPHCLRAPHCADSAPTIEPSNKYLDQVSF